MGFLNSGRCPENPGLPLALAGSGAGRGSAHRAVLGDRLPESRAPGGQGLDLQGTEIRDKEGQRWPKALGTASQVPGLARGLRGA